MTELVLVKARCLFLRVLKKIDPTLSPEAGDKVPLLLLKRGPQLQRRALTSLIAKKTLRPEARFLKDSKGKGKSTSSYKMRSQREAPLLEAALKMRKPVF